ncbi:MAG: hypothetical protein HOC71_03730, partial [Candidatus Latescibacteria bacterium]|nr:hypothetical protein [Candidatus Latescibacterota bacterium]
MKSISIVLVIIFALMLKGCSENDSQGGSDSDEQLKYGTIAGAIFDKDTGEPMPARVYAVGSDDSLYMAEKCIPYDRPMFKSRIGYSGRHFTTIGNTFTVSLPEGIAKIIIEHGKEYLPIEVNVPITAGKTSEIKFNLIRWINMNKNGWYSGDLHVHRPLTDLADLMIAEDLNVACPQTIWGQKKEPDLEKWIDKADDAGTIQIDDRHVFSVLSQEIERFKIGALLMHHTGKTIL